MKSSRITLSLLLVLSAFFCMGLDWNNPTLTSDYQTGVLPDLKARDVAAAKMFEGVADTNIATLTKRYNPSAHALESWNGSAWVAVEYFQAPGSVQMFAGSSAPAGWLLCDGSAVSRTTYSALFAAIGTTYGTGNGSTTFNLPDLRQRFALGKAASGTGSTLGGTGGAIDHTHSAPAHYHGMGSGATLNISSSGTHTTAIDHDHGSSTTDTQGNHYHHAEAWTGLGGAHSHTLTLYENAVGSGSGEDTYAKYSSGRTARTVTTAAVGDHQHYYAFDTNYAGAHAHWFDMPNFVGNSASDGAHAHPAGNFAGVIGLVTGGVDGNAAMTTGGSNPPFQVVNYIIKF